MQGGVSMNGKSLSVGLVGPNDANRLAITRELSGPEVRVLRDYYLQFKLEDLLEAKHDVVIVDLDHDQEDALNLVRTLSRTRLITVMVYSANTELELMNRALEAGANEFLVLPLARHAMSGALLRALARRLPTSIMHDGDLGQLFVFFGVKGGVGVTTIATNFALLLARESGKRVLLIDLDLPLGDIALNLGLKGKYSTVDALDHATKLDANFLSTLLQNYGDNVSVLGAPGHFMSIDANGRAIDKLVAVAREQFDYVVVDSGSRLNFIETDLYKMAATIYMVTQTGIPELRNANRLIDQFPPNGHPALQIVVNRDPSSYHSLDEESVAKALTRPANWKVPNDYATAFRTQNTATPLAYEDSAISKAIRQMARAACGISEHEPEKKRGLFSLFR
jgi:pilus assembly protein CpaE